jgi:hypothetical protein
MSDSEGVADVDEEPVRPSGPFSHLFSLGDIPGVSSRAPRPPTTIPATRRHLSNRASSTACVSRPLLQYLPDRYGWRSDPSTSSTVTDDEQRALFAESVIEARREKKWIRMVSHWPDFQRVHPDKIRKRVLKGIPNSLRGLAWKLVLSGDASPDRPSIDAFIDAGIPPTFRVIDADVTRTLPGLVLLEAVPARGALRRVLHAYANFDPEVGYIQGMAVIAGMFLAYLDETQAFWCFAAVMRDRGIRNLYRGGFVGLGDLNRAWDALVQVKYPKIAAHFATLGLTAIQYTTVWWLTGFMGLELPSALRLRLFDRFVMFGCQALFSFGLVVLSTAKTLLETGELMDCVELLQRPGTSPGLTNWRVALRRYDKKWIGDKEYRHCLSQGNVDFL